MTKNLNKDKKLVWVYPLNNHISEYKQTFVYGYSNPKAKLYLEQGKKSTPVKVFSNGNFAQIVKLPLKNNTIKMVQIVNGKKKTLTRHIAVRKKKNIFTDKPLSHTPKNHLSLLNPVIVVDPGHGGKESGTHSPIGIPEKVFNLQISKLLFKSLKNKMPKVRIHLTRSNDKFVGLDDRVKFARDKKCNLFISIHHNALPDNEDPLKHTGIGIYYTHENIKPIADKFLKSISNKSGLKKHGLFKRNFRVTKPDFYTGILIECGFLIHPVESEIVTSEKVQKKIVEGIVEAICSLNK